MAYSTLASQADTPTAGPDHTYFEAIAANETALLLCTGAKISSTTPQTVAGGVTQILTLGTVEFDGLGGSFTGTANRLTIPTSWGGTYLVQGSLNVNGTSNGSAELRVRKNNTTNVWWEAHGPGAGIATALSLACPFTVQLVATDYLEVYTFNSAGANTLTCQTNGMSLTAIWLHA
jgi:hypothetical protein